jgi:hypothetical protein
MDIISITISLVALIISLTTFWLTRIKKGTIKMTRPTIIFFGPDGVGQDHKKVFIRTLLYCTSDIGQYIQNMFVRLQHGESIQNFNVWVYDNNGLVRGSGLYISNSGLACNHHFLMPKDGTIYNFTSGEYLMQVFIEPINHLPILIFEQKLIINQAQQDEMHKNKTGIYFDWAPNTQNYFSHIDSNINRDDKFIDIINNIAVKEKIKNVKKRRR